MQVGKILSNESHPHSEIDGDELDKGEILDYICSTLDMTEAELIACNGKTLLSTARQVIAKKYPEPHTTIADVSQEHIQAAAGIFLLNTDMITAVLIAEFAWLNHPLEKRSNDMAKIRKAMGNVFATRKFVLKLKHGSATSDRTSGAHHENGSP